MCIWILYIHNFSMNRFLKWLIIWILPILVMMAAAEYLLRKIPNDFQLKSDFYSLHASDIETLILGNSHAYYDLNPVFFKEYTFNGSNVAQALDLDADIFFKFNPAFTRLRCLIIPVSDMSFFFKTKDVADWRLKNYAIYYKMHVSYNPSENYELLSLPFSINRHRLISYYLQRESALTSSELGYGINFKSGQTDELAATTLKAVQQHSLGGIRNFDEERAALEKMIIFCRSKGIEVILFIPPAYTTYTAQMDTARLQTTLKVCDEFTLKYNNVHFFNLLKDPLFNENDYYDVDHLNEIGAKKLSLKVDSIVSHLRNESF